MPIIPYVNQLEPNEDAVIWRFMDLFKFRDLMASEELYFRRADLFTDESEGLPPEQYAMRVLGLDPYDIRDRVKLNDHLGFLAQNRESYYISCWHLYRQETLDMWDQYGDDGVAVCSRYGLLKSALDGLLDEVVISPWAEKDIIEEIEIWVKSRGLPAPKPSELTSGLTPKL